MASPMEIKYQVSKPVLCGNEKLYAVDAIDSGWISSTGTYIGKFEKAVADILEVDECLSTSNGTTALHLACLALGLKPGDEVLVPALTYVASANAIAYCGAIPVLVDCDPITWNCTPEAFEKAWTEKTVGVLAVHLYGLPCNVDTIAELCRKRSAWLIEDCAESLGATIDGKPVGSFGDAATFSFYGNKTISTGEGGMVFLRNPEQRTHARMLRGQGMDLTRRYWHPILGYNYRLTNVAAAIGLGQIEMASFHIGERRRIASRYMDNLQPLVADGLMQLPATVTGYAGTYWLFSAVLSQNKMGQRDSVMRTLASAYGIETRPFFVPMNHLPMYLTDRKFPVTEFLSSNGINFPTYTGLLDTEIDEICEKVIKVVRAIAGVQE
jgi:perosamine synthetase